MTPPLQLTQLPQQVPTLMGAVLPHEPTESPDGESGEEASEGEEKGAAVAGADPWTGHGPAADVEGCGEVEEDVEGVDDAVRVGEEGERFGGSGDEEEDREEGFVGPLDAVREGDGGRGPGGGTVEGDDVDAVGSGNGVEGDRGRASKT